MSVDRHRTHLAAVLIGEGEAQVAGRIVPARDALAAQGLEPLVLGPKEGLALLNGTQVSTALGLNPGYVSGHASGIGETRMPSSSL